MVRSTENAFFLSLFYLEFYYLWSKIQSTKASTLLLDKLGSDSVEHVHIFGLCSNVQMLKTDQATQYLEFWAFNQTFFYIYLETFLKGLSESDTFPLQVNKHSLDDASGESVHCYPSY